MIGPNDIIPSHLTTQHRKSSAFGNGLLRFGEVIDIIPPDSKESFSGKVPEYTVYTQHRDNGTAVTRAYHHCFLINDLAGLADNCTFTLRVDPDRPKGKTGKGSKVLILCVNGETNNAVIIGGIPDEASTYGVDNKDKGHYFHWVFNGISFDVNDDGEVTATYNGKTKADGKADDSVSKDNAGGTFAMTKDGKFKAKPKQGFEIGEATDKMLLGESYRQEQKKENTKLQAQFKSLQTLLQSAGGALQTAGAAVAGPFMASTAGPALTLASQFIIQAAQMAGQLSQTVADFEQAAGQKNDFLSKDHKND